MGTVMTKPNILLAAVLAALMGLLGVTAAAAKGFKTPEAAVTAYIEAVAAHDFDQVLAATAIDDMSTNFDFVAFVDRLKALVVSAPAPSSDPMFVAINKATYTAAIAKQVQFLTYGLLSTSALIEGKSVESDAAGATAFENETDPSRLESLTVIKIASPSADIASSARYLAVAASQAKTYGADELVERIALLSFEGTYSYIGFTLLRYGDNWGVSSQVSALAGTSSLGVPTPVTPEAFDTSLN